MISSAIHRTTILIIVAFVVYFNVSPASAADTPELQTKYLTGEVDLYSSGAFQYCDPPREIDLEFERFTERK